MITVSLLSSLFVKSGVFVVSVVGDNSGVLVIESPENKAGPFAFNWVDIFTSM